MEFRGWGIPPAWKRRSFVTLHALNSVIRSGAIASSFVAVPKNAIAFPRKAGCGTSACPILISRYERQHALFEDPVPATSVQPERKVPRTPISTETP